MFCVTDLQFSNQKLQQEVRKLKQSVETMEDHNQKLAEENEELKSQARLYGLYTHTQSRILLKCLPSYSAFSQLNLLLGPTYTHPSIMSLSPPCRGQQLAQKEKMLKDEVEEMKMSLSCTEEGRARASAQTKHMVYTLTHTTSLSCYSTIYTEQKYKLNVQQFQRFY